MIARSSMFMLEMIVRDEVRTGVGDGDSIASLYL